MSRARGREPLYTGVFGGGGGDGLTFDDVGLGDDEDDYPLEVVDQLIEKATPNREYIMRLTQSGQLRPEVLSVIRDMLIAGDDVDAIGILASELGLGPPARKPGQNARDRLTWAAHYIETRITPMSDAQRDDIRATIALLHRLRDGHGFEDESEEAL